MSLSCDDALLFRLPVALADASVPSARPIVAPRFFETFSFLPALTNEQISKQVSLPLTSALCPKSLLQGRAPCPVTCQRPLLRFMSPP